MNYLDTSCHMSIMLPFQSQLRRLSYGHTILNLGDMLSKIVQLTTRELARQSFIQLADNI